MHANPPYADQRCLRPGSPPDEKKLGAALAASRAERQKILYLDMSLKFRQFSEYFASAKDAAAPGDERQKNSLPEAVFGP
jgi:hypothetical protein